jgi:protein-tyrosine phosphatase
LIDLHTHILPGFDDGVRSLEQARDLAREAAAEGVSVIAATPHVRDDYPTSPDRMERGVQALRAEFAEAGIEVEIVCGGEVAIERLWDLSDEEVRRFTYHGAGRYLLVEFPYYDWPALLEPTLLQLRASGIRPLLAHPERNAAVQADPSRLGPVVREGALVQLTAGSLSGSFGSPPRAAALRLLELGLAHVLATDAHGAHVAGRGGLASAVGALSDSALAKRLTIEVPAAILAGEDV